MDFTNRIFIVFDGEEVFFAAHSVRAAISHLIKAGWIDEGYIVDFSTNETIKDYLGENWESVLMNMSFDEYNALCGADFGIGSYSVAED